MRIGISRNQFTVSEALSLYFLRKCDNEFEFQEIDGDDLSLFDLYLQDGNIYVNASRQGHEQKLAKAQSTLVAAVGRLKNDILRCKPATKLTCAGTAYALCCVKDLEKRVQAKFPKYTMKLLHMDIAHIYQATVEVVDAEYWRIALPSLALELKHTNAQKEDFLIRVREISEMLPGGISDLEKEVVENGEENPATFHSIVADSIDLIGLEYEHIVDWFFNEWFDINTNCWIGLDYGYKIHYAGVIMFIQPTPINYYNWSVLEAYIKKLRDFEENAISLPMVVHLTETSAVKLVILKGTEIRATGQKFLLPLEWKVNSSVMPGIVSIAHSRDHAIAESFESAYNLAMKALQKLCKDTDLTPRKENIDYVKKLSNDLLVKAKSAQIS
ncbi:hypothetical protein Ddc_11694 [Ditylenchus destructor]|nr:hypothetical protein Ddc_11694 [Ditylenchus destructor]